MTSLLHIIPKHVFLNEYQGSYKDVIGRVRLLQHNPAGYRQIILESQERLILDELIGDIQPTHILVEYSSLGCVVARLRERYPKAFIAVRAHNIEPLQQFDNRGCFPMKRLPQLLYSCLLLLRTDWLSARYADTIYSISQWETEHYWKRIPGCRSAHWLPYFTPEYLLPSHISAERNIIACMPSSLEHRKTQDLVSRFGRFATLAEPVDGATRFVVTGDLSAWKMKMPASVQLTGMIKDLPEFMTRVRAVALLSPLGYGFKTTIADAIASGCYVILHSSLYKRCPDILKPACIEMGQFTIQEATRILKHMEKPFPLQNVTQRLKALAVDRIIADFG